MAKSRTKVSLTGNQNDQIRGQFGDAVDNAWGESFNEVTKARDTGTDYAPPAIPDGVYKAKLDNVTYGTYTGKKQYEGVQIPRMTFGYVVSDVDYEGKRPTGFFPTPPGDRTALERLLFQFQRVGYDTSKWSPQDLMEAADEISNNKKKKDVKIKIKNTVSDDGRKFQQATIQVDKKEDSPATSRRRRR